ncbi:glycosyltransferase [Cohnella rhizosphaerae]|uniref:Glycosyltransferase n=1 Tax=Cohnella rhizosphaerae TaxID=1457232 RepID=A0A9X4L1H4_9BACL|nr:glycosyltransferase [Cohnella rhizosphaerae]MDG0811807.1 glycosyltransferase [Cohnella rhizosphaerae]
MYFGIEKWLDRINKTHILVSSVNEYTDTSKMMRADKRLRRISNSVHLSYEALRREEEKLVITVGRLTAAKNPQLWLDVIEEACNLEHGLRFVWVGDGEYREYIETQAKERRLPLTITGWMERPDIEAWYRRCSVYVQLSLWEGLPLAVLEAMAAECAIVVSDIPAHRELIRHGANGYIALNRNEAVQAILSLIDSPRTCRQFGHAAREVVEEKYSIRQFSAQIRQYYNSILDGGAKYDRTHSISVGHHTML